MTGRSTRRRGARTAFAGVTLAAAAIAASVATLSTRTPGAPAVVTRSDDRPVAVIASDHRPTRRSRSIRSAPGRPRVRGARATTRVFLRGFLAFEMGDATPRATRRLRAAASPRLARLLLAAAPRRPLSGSAPRRARLRKLDLYSDRRGRAKAVATLARGGDIQRLELTLDRGAGGWRVADLG